MSTNKSTASASRARAAERAERSEVGSAGPGTAELGTAVVGTLVGFVIFLTLLLFSAQLLVRLYATSALTSAAIRAAESVAEAPNPADEVAPAEAEARSQLGSFGASHTTFLWKEVDANQIVLEVSATSPGFVPGPVSWRTISRTVTVRTETFRQ